MKHLVKVVLVFLSFFLFFSCKTKEKFNFDFSIDKEAALRLYKMRIRKYIIDFELEAAVEYSSDLLASTDEDFSALGKTYISHLADIYYKVALKLQEAGRAADSMEALISAEALDEKYRDKNTKNMIGIAKEMVGHYWKEGDEENAFLIYEALKRNNENFSIKALEERYNKRVNYDGGDLRDFLSEIGYNVASITTRYTFTDEDGVAITEEILSAGILVAPDMILTTLHTIRPLTLGKGYSASYTARFEDGSEFALKIFSEDGIGDIALLVMVNGSRVPKPSFGEIVGNSDEVKATDILFGSGGPYLLEDIKIRDEVATVNQRPWQVGSWMVFDNVFPKEYSGAPIFSGKKKLVGIMACGGEIADEKSYIIPINTIRRALHYMKQGKCYPYSWLGIMLSPPSENGKEEGLRVKYVFASSPAFFAGIEPQDRIISINHRNLSSIAQAQEMIFTRRTGGVSAVEVSRMGKRKVFYLIHTDRPFSPNVVDFERIDEASMLKLYFGFTSLPQGTKGGHRKLPVIDAVDIDSIADNSGFISMEPFEILFNKFYYGKEAIKIRYYHSSLPRGAYKTYILISGGFQYLLL